VRSIQLPIKGAKALFACLGVFVGLSVPASCDRAKPQAGEANVSSVSKPARGPKLGPGDFVVALGATGDPPFPGSELLLRYGMRQLVAERNQRVHVLEELVPKQRGREHMECLVWDVATSDSQNGTFETLILYYGEGIPEPQSLQLRELGCRPVRKEDWDKLRPLLSAATQTMPATKTVMTDYREASLLSYYDGSDWHLMPRFYLRRVGDSFPLDKSALLIFKVYIYIGDNLGMRESFARYLYGNHSLSFPMIMEEAEKAFYEGRPWPVP
jgi:hypothetical protein